MAIRLVLAFFAFWALILAHYLWTSSTLRPTLGEIEFGAPEAMSYRIGLLPVDRYSVAFKFDRYSQVERSVLEGRRAMVDQLRAEPINVEITITGALGRRLSNWAEHDVLAWKGREGRPWNLNQRGEDPMVRLYGPARFIAVPFERYTVSTRIFGPNNFLSDRVIHLELMASRDDGYHGLGQFILIVLSVLVFAMFAIVWIVAKLNSYRRR